MFEGSNNFAANKAEATLGMCQEKTSDPQNRNEISLFILLFED
jgi:hypothetical protein